MKRKLIIKIGFLLSILAVFTLVILALFTRKSVLESSEETALTVAELVRDTLTSYMVLGVIDRRDVFLNQVKSTHGLEWVRVIRGEAVVRQFGRRGMDERTADALEIEALRLGERRSDLIEGRDRVIYRLVIPYKAERSCITCHQVKEGE
ncbi:MAG TPA: GGDEF domain-containing protein, partial [Aquifex aeolicus]|nr:GGDEF domain-containing protein [Aquifex aeolicus]